MCRLASKPSTLPGDEMTQRYPQKKEEACSAKVSKTEPISSCYQENENPRVILP